MGSLSLLPLGGKTNPAVPVIHPSWAALFPPAPSQEVSFQQCFELRSCNNILTVPFSSAGWPLQRLKEFIAGPLNPLGSLRSVPPTVIKRETHCQKWQSGSTPQPNIYCIQDYYQRRERQKTVSTSCSFREVWDGDNLVSSPFIPKRTNAIKCAVERTVWGSDFRENVRIGDAFAHLHSPLLSVWYTSIFWIIDAWWQTDSVMNLFLGHWWDMERRI